MKAVLGDTVLAESPKEDLISIEGNWYFPPSSVNTEYLVESSTPYTCPWKGECQYFSVKDQVSGEWLQDRAWTYRTPFDSAIARVGADFSNYVAFWKEVSALSV